MIYDRTDNVNQGSVCLHRNVCILVLDLGSDEQPDDLPDGLSDLSDNDLSHDLAGPMCQKPGT